MAWRFAVEFIAAVIMFGVVGGIFYGAFRGTLSLNFRTIQFMAVSFLVPAILILSLERAISSEATSALMGIIVGYVLSVLGKGE